MHFRDRGKIVQIIRTSHDADSKKDKNEIVGRLVKSKLQISPELEAKLTAKERKVVVAWIEGCGNIEQLRKQLELEPIGAAFPQCYAKVQADLEAEGRKIGDRDTIIAARALSLGAAMVTVNFGEFSRIKGLTVEIWELGIAGH